MCIFFQSLHHNNCSVWKQCFLLCLLVTRAVHVGVAAERRSVCRSVISVLHKDTLSCLCPSLSTLYDFGPADRRLCCSPVQCACILEKQSLTCCLAVACVAWQSCAKMHKSVTAAEAPVTAGGQLLISLQSHTPIRRPFRSANRACSSQTPKLKVCVCQEKLQEWKQMWCTVHTEAMFKNVCHSWNVCVQPLELKLDVCSQIVLKFTVVNPDTKLQKRSLSKTLWI